MPEIVYTELALGLKQLGIYSPNCAQCGKNVARWRKQVGDFMSIILCNRCKLVETSK